MEFNRGDNSLFLAGALKIGRQDAEDALASVRTALAVQYF